MGFWMLYFKDGKEKLNVHPQKLRKLIYCWLEEDVFLSGKQKDLPCYLNKFQTFGDVRTTKGCTFFFLLNLFYLSCLNYLYRIQ